MTNLAEQLKARKSLLMPCETVVRPMPVCQAGLEEQGLDFLGGDIEEEKTEDEHATLDAAKRCAEALRTAQHAVAYTGAGISTATGISDYRGPNGVWTSLATGRIPDDSFDNTSATPSYAHMSIARLLEKGFLKFCMSTNLDCLHAKSGLTPLVNLAEVHGNIYVERCTACEEEVLRPFPIRRTLSRATGRKCTCGADCMDSGIDFGQDLPRRHLELSQQEAKKSDFSIVIGTSMRVRPASEIPLLGTCVAADGPRGTSAARLCIVNRMDTPFDDRASIRTYAEADVFFFHVLRELGVEVNEPPECSLKTTSQMKKLATKLLPPSNGHFVGEEEKFHRMDVALSQVEAQLQAEAP